jgi:dihydroflavonol-4-reductase
MPPLCFVTGATGFVGRHLAPLLARDYRLRVLVRPGRTMPFAGDLAERLEGDLDDREVLARGVAGAELVVHLAALVSFRAEDDAAMQRINADATAVLAALSRAAGVARLLHVSTISAVGYRDRPEVIDEQAPYNFGPLRIGYCDSKHAAERAVLAECARGLDAVVVNPPTMFGAGDRRKGEGSLITTVLEGRLGFAPPGGLNVANVADVCDGIVAAIARGRSGERYILGGENLTNRQTTFMACEIVGVKPPRITQPRWTIPLAGWVLDMIAKIVGPRLPLSGEQMRLTAEYIYFDSSKAQRELSLPHTPIRQAMQECYDWYVEHRYL